jgi:hypothetical protein
MLSIYLPIVREELFSFVRTWNAHYIRKQKDRPNIVHGIPRRMYKNPPSDTENFGIPYNADTLLKVEEDLQVYDTYAYLPQDVLNWCNIQFEEMGFDPYNARLAKAEDRAQPFYAQYIELRTRANSHIETRLAPVLRELPTPRDGWEWNVSV